MAIESIPMKTKEIEEIENAETAEEQLRLCIRYITDLQFQVCDLQNQLEEQKQKTDKYKKAVYDIDLSQHVLQFNAEEFLAWAREADRRAKNIGVRLGKKKQKEEDDLLIKQKASWNNYVGM